MNRIVEYDEGLESDLICSRAKRSKMVKGGGKGGVN